MKPAIMIVDDAAFMRRLIKKALINGGYDKIIEAENGKAALELYKSERPELVFLDITMPERSGLDVLDDILTEDPGARVLMCSAICQESVIARAIQRGARDFIVKPFKEEALLKLVEASL